MSYLPSSFSGLTVIGLTTLFGLLLSHLSFPSYWLYFLHKIAPCSLPISFSCFHRHPSTKTIPSCPRTLLSVLYWNSLHPSSSCAYSNTLFHLSILVSLPVPVIILLHSPDLLLTEISAMLALKQSSTHLSSSPNIMFLLSQTPVHNKPSLHDVELSYLFYPVPLRILLHPVLTLTHSSTHLSSSVYSCPPVPVIILLHSPDLLLTETSAMLALSLIYPFHLTSYSCFHRHPSTNPP